MKFTGTIVLIYGLLVIMGGVAGYLLAGSWISLLTGSVLGALLFASGLGIVRSSPLAFFTALGSSILLSVLFGIRYFQTSAMTPHGEMALFSMIIVLLLLTTKGRPKRRS